MGKRRLKSCVAKRITSILLAAAMAVSTPVGTLFNANSVAKAADDGWETTTLVENGDFESCSTSNSISGWTISPWLGNNGLWYVDNRNNSDPYSKNETIYLKTDNSGSDPSNFSMSQSISNVQSGTYKVSIRSTGSPDVSSGISISISDGTTTRSKNLGKATSWGTWVTTDTEELEITSTSTLTVTISGTVPSDYYGYIDDIVISKKTTDSSDPSGDDPSGDDPSGDDPTVVASEGELVNGDFETENKGWTLAGGDGGAPFYASDSYDSNTTQFIKIESPTAAQNMSVKQTINNYPAGTYKLSYSISGANDAEFPLTAKVLDADDNVLVSQNGEKLTGWSNWSTVTTDKFVLEDTSTIKIVFEGEVPTTFWGSMDDVKLIPVTTPNVDPIESSLYVKQVDLADDFITGFDISSYLSIKESGATYKDADGKELSDKEFFDLLKNSGVNWVRIRVWVDPTENGKTYGGGHNDLATAKTIGKLATDSGLRVLIDFHYSDFWTNPGKQSAPKAWKDLTLDEKATKLSEYTTDSLNQLIAAGVDVGMVQVGNETNDGFCGETNMSNMCTLFAAGADAVRGVSSDILIAIHVADPQKLDFSSYADELEKNGVDYDVFASSYYPYWHGELSNLSSKIKAVADKYGKKVMVAETSYVHTLDDGDGHENTESEGKLSVDTFPYPIGLQGQALHIRNVVDTIASLDSGIGVFYWEPAWIPVQHYDATASNAAEVLASNKEKWEKYGSGWATSAAADYDMNVGEWYGGSAVDNEGVFDFDGKALPTLQIYNMIRYGTTASDYIVEAIDIEAEFDLGEEITLPDTVKVFFASGAQKDATVTWNADDLAAAKEKEGEYYVRGTAKYDDKNYEVICTLTIKPYNYLINPGFEDDTNTAWVIDNPGEEENYKSHITDVEDSHSGNKEFHFWGEEAFVTGFSQTVSLEAGKYNFGGYIQGGNMGDDAEVYFYVDIDGEITKYPVTLKGWKEWQNGNIEFELEETSKVTVGMYISGGAGGWGTADDFYLNKLEIEETKEEPKEETKEEAVEETKEEAVEETKEENSDNAFATYQGYRFYKDEDGNITCYDSNGKKVIDEFKCDGTYTYYFQFDGTAMKDRLTYHPDGEHVIYFDSEGHEVFSDIAHVKRSIAGDEVDDYCFFDVFGYLYVDVITWDKTGTVLYYANPYGVLEMGKWFQFSDTVKWGDGRETEGIAGGYGYATEDGTLMTNQFTYDWEGNFCYMQGNGTILR